MKYMLLITQGEWYANGSAEARDEAMQKVVDWWGKQYASGKMVGGSSYSRLTQPRRSSSSAASTRCLIDH